GGYPARRRAAAHAQPRQAQSEGARDHLEHHDLELTAELAGLPHAFTECQRPDTQGRHAYARSAKGTRGPVDSAVACRGWTWCGGCSASLPCSTLPTPPGRRSGWTG